MRHTLTVAIVAATISRVGFSIDPVNVRVRPSRP